jgi:REP element-mobilizing transposase RayT
MIPLRHPSRDNAGPGWWFLTINAYQHQELFGRVEANRVVLSEAGHVVRDCWEAVPLHFPHAVPDAWVVMPNHVHAILRLKACDPELVTRAQRLEAFGRPVSGSVATIVRSFKAAVTKTVRDRFDGIWYVWQSRFWDRKLFDERSIRRARAYILNNPARWHTR